jgi:5'-deoxy-5'-methylthioadenosine phosphorylase
MAEIALIGGTGLSSLKMLEITHREMVQTPYGPPSAPVIHGRVAGKEVVFLARHGSGHTIPPHKVNYRANIWALKNLGVKKVIAVAAVGGISDETTPGSIVIPDQVIDYTTGRDCTYFESNLTPVTHIDFTFPYCEALRQELITACGEAEIRHTTYGCYGATQGPRLETAAEIRRMEQDGCSIVGMTGMPEAALARELELCYSCCAVVANKAAGKGEGEISMKEIEKFLAVGMESVRKVFETVLPVI